MNARFVAQATGGYKLELVSASLTPQAIERKPPVFPRGLDARKLGAVVVARVVVGTNGRIDPASASVLKFAATSGTEQELDRVRRAALDALAASKYQPDQLDGTPVATEMLQSFRFCASDCTKPPEPELSAERDLLPRIVGGNARPARLPAALRARVAGMQGKALRFRLAIDAVGKVLSATPLGEGDAAVQEATRLALLGLHYFPATVQGRPVASEMPVNVPVRIENGVAQPQLGRVALDVALVSYLSPRVTHRLENGEILARLHIITAPDGRADPALSGVEIVKILPSPPAVLKHQVQQDFENALRQVRLETVQVDGKGVAIEFWRSYYSTFCTAPARCDPKPGASPPPDPPIKMPPGVELARLKP